MLRHCEDCRKLNDIKKIKLPDEVLDHIIDQAGLHETIDFEDEDQRSAHNKTKHYLDMLSYRHKIPTRVVINAIDDNGYDYKYIEIVFYKKRSPVLTLSFDATCFDPDWGPERLELLLNNYIVANSIRITLKPGSRDILREDGRSDLVEFMYEDEDDIDDDDEDGPLILH